MVALRASLALFLAAAKFCPLVKAECPNHCSGHGQCGSYDMCTCDQGFHGADCSLRICPFGMAHVDIPKGDLDSSSSISDSSTITVLSSSVYPSGTTEGYPRMVDTAGNVLSETGHDYSECSSKGMCDRRSGICQCLPGYEGTACQKASCPNAVNMDADAIKGFNTATGGLTAQNGLGNQKTNPTEAAAAQKAAVQPTPCSGHGTCKTVSELAKMDSGNTYNLWDKDSTMGCYCDHGYTGPACSERQCPKGIDPLYTDDATVRVAQQTVRFETSANNVLSGTYALIFYDIHGEDYKTVPLNVHGTGVYNAVNHCDEVVNALKGLPDKVVEDVECTQSAINTDMGFEYTLTFTKNPGPLKEVKVDQYLDGLRSTVEVSSGTLDISVFTKVNGEAIDYFPDRCEGLKVKILADSADGDDSWTAATVRPGSLGYISGVSGPLTTAEMKLLRACLGDSDWDPDNNVDVANWDEGVVVEATNGPVTYNMIGAFPHAIKVVPVETSAGYDKYKYGEYHLVFYDSTATNKEFRVANINNGFNLPSEAVESYLYTTKGTVQQLGWGSEPGLQIADNSASGSSSTRIVAYFDKGDNKLYTNYDTSCENQPSGAPKNHKCVEKGDKLFVVDGCWGPGDLAAGTVNPIFGGTALHASCTDSTAVNYHTGNIYTVTKVHKKKLDADSEPLGPTATINTGGDPNLELFVNYNVIEVDANFAWTGPKGDPEDSDLLHDDSTWSDNTGVVTLFHFTPLVEEGYEYISECSNRGLCDPTSGVCRCFRGYTGNECSVQSVLAGATFGASGHH